MTDAEINAIADRAAEKAVQGVLAALGLVAGTQPAIFLRSLTVDQFAACVERHPEYIRRLLRARSAKIPPEFIQARRPYKLKGSLLPKWGITADLAIARMVAATKPAQIQPPSPLQSAA